MLGKHFFDRRYSSDLKGTINNGNYRGSDMPSGWSVVGGQTQPAYVPTGLDSEDSSEGHSVSFSL